MDRFVRLAGFVAASGIASLALAAAPQRLITKEYSPPSPADGCVVATSSDRRFLRRPPTPVQIDVGCLQRELHASMHVSELLLTELKTLQHSLSVANQTIRNLTGTGVAEKPAEPGAACDLSRHGSAMTTADAITPGAGDRPGEPGRYMPGESMAGAASRRLTVVLRFSPDSGIMLH